MANFEKINETLLNYNLGTQVDSCLPLLLTVGSDYIKNLSLVDMYNSSEPRYLQLYFIAPTRLKKINMCLYIVTKGGLISVSSNQLKEKSSNKRATPYKIEKGRNIRYKLTENISYNCYHIYDYLRYGYLGRYTF